MKVFIILSLLLGSSSLFADEKCHFMVNSNQICRIDQPSNVVRIDINRPDQEICGLRLLSTNEDGAFFSEKQALELNDRLVFGAKSVVTENFHQETFQLSPLSHSATGYQITVGTGRVFGYANSFFLRTKSGESLKTVLSDILILKANDLVLLQPAECIP